MFRRLISAFAVFALLLQVTAAWAQPHMSAQEPTPSISSEHEAMPCHEGKAELKKVSGKSCCKGECKCANACAAHALPTQASELDDFISAHFEALRSQSAEVPAHTLPPQRPPATPKG